MSSEIKVDTISENTSANGVAIDGLTIKDGGITATTGDVVFNEASASVDLRVETNGQTHALFVDGSADAIGLFNSAPSFTSGQGMHLADDVKIGFGDGGSSRPDFQLSADSSNLGLACGFGGDTADINISTGGIISTGQETAPDSSGLTLNQGGNDTAILSLKSSDVAHGMTSLEQTDTWASFHKDNADAGGVRIRICSGQVKSLKIECFATGENTAEATTALSNFAVDARPKSGTSVQSHDGDANIASFRTGDAAQVIFKGDGEIFSNQTSTVGTFDEYDDAQLIRSYDLTRGEGNKVKGLIASKFDKFVKYNRDDLKDARLIGKDENGNATNFINLNGFIRLHNGAIWQQYEKHQKLANAMYELAKVAVGEDKANEILEQNDIKLLN
tara:strand:+ start:1 stop:1167 length:1167 start_codon:yes stop_codon:yes gene_type:complete